MAIDVDRINAVLLKMRAAKSALTRDYEAQKASIEAQMKALENALLGHLQSNNVRSMATASGTAYVETVLQASCQDWGAYHGWMIQTGRMEGLEKRVGQAFIKQYAEEHDGELPPGIVAHREQVIRVRVANT